MALNKLVEWIITKIKGEQYFLTEDIGTEDMFIILRSRFKDVIRGIWKRFWIRGRGIVFSGKRATIRHAKHFEAGNNLILGENVFIDALSRENIVVGNNVTIAANSRIVCTGVVRNIGKGICLGNSVAIGSGSTLLGQGGIYIGDDTIMGPNVCIISENHIFSRKDIPIRLQGETRRGIVIGRDCWIGAGATILDGVHIGDRVIVGAGAVVTHDIPSNSIAKGIPATAINV